MPFTVACFCGLLWEAEPPAACPRCGVTISPGITPADQAWMDHMRDDIGWTTTMDTEETGAEW